jgi:hypothetical protein
MPNSLISNGSENDRVLNAGFHPGYPRCSNALWTPNNSRLPQALKKFVTIVSIIAAWMLAVIGGCSHAPSRIEADLQPPVIDLGDIRQGTEHFVSFRLHNRGHDDLTLRGKTTSCGCTISETPVPVMVGSGRQLSLDAMFVADRGIGPQSATVLAELVRQDKEPRSPRPPRPHILSARIRANVLTEFDVVPSRLTVPDLRLGETREFQIFISTPFEDEYIVESVSTESPILLAHMQGRCIARSPTMLRLTVDTRQYSGPERVRSKVVLKLSGGPVNFVSIPVEISIHGMIEAVPPNIVFMVPDDESLQTRTLKLRSRIPFQVLSVKGPTTCSEVVPVTTGFATEHWIEISLLTDAHVRHPAIMIVEIQRDSVDNESIELGIPVAFIHN